MKTFILSFFSLFLLTAAQAQVFEKVKDITPQPMSGYTLSDGYKLFLELENELYFPAFDDANGIELWKTDGTNIGTIMVKDINPTGDSSPGSFINYTDKLFFSANDGVNGYELWVTDGTETGTVLLKDINPGNANSTPREFCEYNGQLYFTAIGNTGSLELWTTDGTTSGTVKIKEIQSSASLTSRLRVFDDKIFITYGNDGVNGYELWVSDGTAAGTVMFKDINPGSGNSWPREFCEYNGKLYFVADDGTHSAEVWATDGTASGTAMLKDINPNGNGSPLYFKVFEENLYFYANGDVNGFGTWVSDGTETGTVLLTDKFPVNQFSPIRPNYSEFEGKLYFSANETATGIEPWSTDGTTSGTTILKDIIPGGDFSGSTNPCFFTEYNGKLYFRASNPETGFSIYESDGTTEGTIKIEPLGFSGFNPLEYYGTEFRELNGALYFNANYDGEGFHLWRYTDTNLSIGTEHTTNVDFSIYPNPANHTLNLKYSGEIKNIRVIDLNGRMLQQWEGTTAAVDISSLNAGMYFIQIQTQNGTGTTSFIKK